MTLPSHHAPSGFRNPWPGSEQQGVSGLLKWMLTRSSARSASSPAYPEAPTIAASVGIPPDVTEDLTITWIGHSTFLIQCDGLNVLTDPMWSDRASPVWFAGPRRLVPPGLRLDDLPEIDITLLSHDHYDHLDDRTVRHLASRFPRMQWAAPLGVGSFLRSRGAASVTEFDWWQEREISDTTIGCTPAQHFSGRSPWDRNRTLWSGWTVAFPRARVFFAGDTGFHPEFGAIASRFGPFDMAILPIGAYEPRWFMRPVHMNPDDSVMAFTQLLANAANEHCVMVGSHWGTFRLTDEPVMEPPALTRQRWSTAGLPAERLWILGHGETRQFGPG
ncbi:MAG: MBL fold metallo-hydrolase [Gemmatimonadales bacterium]